MTATSQGPLAGVRVVEFAGIGPAPHCGMLLSDFGADVLRIDRPAGGRTINPVLDRGKATLALDLKSPAGNARALAILDKADVLIEGFRPGVMERLGLGPDVVCARNPRLVYGRMTGWGQSGPLADRAGHDINYIAITGALAPMGPLEGPSMPPLNLVGDFGGGSLYFALGIVAALYERAQSGRGQVIDAAIVDGVASLLAIFQGMAATDPSTPTGRGHHFLGGASPYYRSYICADGKEIAVGALEPQFYDELLSRAGAPEDLRREQRNERRWPERSETLARIFKQRSRDEWCAMFDGSDACVAPVLTPEEAAAHPHMRERRVFETHDGVRQAAAAPRLSRTPGTARAGRSATTLLREWGLE